MSQEWKAGRRVRAALESEHVPPRAGFEERMRAALRSAPQKKGQSWRAELVAAALILLFVGGTIAGVRIWRNLNTPPAATTSAEQKSLESRPLLFQTVGADAQCPLTPITLGAYGLKIGDGPVYVISNDTPIKTGWGSWAAYKFGYLARKSGRVLLRARDLRTGQIIVFADNPLGPSAITATGSALGTDQLAGKTVTIRSEAISKDAIQVAPNYNQATLPYATVMIGEKGGGSGCVGLQFDGPDFTENVVIRLSGHGL